MSLLENLYKEYNDLRSKLDKVQEMIVLYGGKLPLLEISEIAAIKSSDEVGKALDMVLNYQIDSSWKNKILFILRKVGRPMSTVEIANEISKNEPTRTKSDCTMVASQYCSNLSRGENPVLKASKPDGSNRKLYSII